MRPLLLYLLVAPVAFAKDIAQKEKYASSPRFECPIYDIVFYGHDLDVFKDIGSWEECGTYLVYVKKEKTKLFTILISAHICNIASGCKFWSWIGSGNHHCYTKDSNGGCIHLYYSGG